MRHVCAWCGKALEPAVDPPDRSDLITHGICSECESFIASNERRSLREFLNLFAEPVMCVDGDFSILTANDSACLRLGLEGATLGDLLCGELIQCRWACSPGGCGSTEHCLGCGIREIVRATLEPGAPCLEGSAYLEREQEDGSLRILRLTLTSEHRWGTVLLRIDGIEEAGADARG